MKKRMKLCNIKFIEIDRLRSRTDLNVDEMNIQHVYDFGIYRFFRWDREATQSKLKNSKKFR